ISLAEVTSGGTKRSRAERPACGAQNKTMPTRSADGAIVFDFILIFMLFDSRRFHLGALGHLVAMIGTFGWRKQSSIRRAEKPRLRGVVRHNEWAREPG